MITRILALTALGGLLALPACTSGQSAVQPHFTPANVATSALQFQVGTANLNGAAGLNTVVTFRQPDGFSALLDSTPAITLPFTNTAPAAMAGNDAGTNHITGSPQTPNGVASTPTTFGQTVGAFAYGFLASNSTTSGANNSVFYPANNAMPYYTAGARRAFYVGPGNAFVPNFKDGSLGTAFNGYPSGFTTFALAPVTGQYSLSVGLQGASTQIPSFTATTQMTSTALLPVMPAPVVTSTTDAAGNATGGLVVTENVPAGILETLIFIQDRTSGNYYTLMMRGTGPQTATLAPNLGPVANGVAGPSLAPGAPPNSTPGNGDAYRVYAFGFDYAAIEAVPVGANVPQAPVINNVGTPCTFSGTSSTCFGQADLTQSAAVTGAE